MHLQNLLTIAIVIVFTFIGFVRGAAIEHDSDNVAIDLAVPRGQTREEYLQSIIDYWTPERMASAKPLDPVIHSEKEFFQSNVQPKKERATTILTDSDLLPGMVLGKPHIAGKVYFVLNGSNYLCSGSVVNADNRDTVVTAGHCVFEYERKIWASKWTFVPKYASGSRPMGSFTMRKMATKSRWMNNRDFNHDVGIVLMNTNERGEHIQDVAGGLGITLDPPRQGYTYSFGYPKNLNNGEIVSNCTGLPLSPTFVSGFTGLQLSCRMTGGSSGGPWIHEYNVNTRQGQQVSVNSFIMSNRPNYLFGPYFTEDNIGTLYREYQHQ